MNQDNNSSEQIPSKEYIQILRTEIIESEKAKIELLKYKLIAVASIATIGLGFSGHEKTNPILAADYVLCIIPFVCAYVDLLCYHTIVRILVIAQFLSSNGDPYESYIQDLEENNAIDLKKKCFFKGGIYKYVIFKEGTRYFFNLEDIALFWSSIGLSTLINLSTLFIIKDVDMSLIFAVTGLVGALICVFTKLIFESHQQALKSKNNPRILLQKLTNILANFTDRNNSLRVLHDVFFYLKRKGSFYFPILENGLFPAANLQTESKYTGYSNVWVRDNIHIAYAHYIYGCNEIALKNVTTLTDYFLKYQWRFEKIISDELDFNDPMNRPHVRFNGEILEEIDQKWAHAQNDALGYFLWLFCKLFNDKVIAELTQPQSQLLAIFALYFDKIMYWQDEDNGHWEEAKKIEASSIGVVVAALIELKTVVQQETNLIQNKDKFITTAFLNELIEKGRQSLKQILPAECIQFEKYRPYDAALLFLIFPLDIVQDESLENQIMKNVIEHLQGDYGIRRYIGDSYWSADYKAKLNPEQRTIDVSDNMASRDSLLQIGLEAQWCIFDPIISIIYGKKYQKTKKQKYMQLQIKYFDRSLKQLTPEDSPFGGFKCPELYYLENDQYIPNDTTPLLWTQANLWIAFKFMKQSLSTSR